MPKTKTKENICGNCRFKRIFGTGLWCKFQYTIVDRRKKYKTLKETDTCEHYLKPEFGKRLQIQDDE